MKFQKETDLCAAFISTIPNGWTNYNETGGFDILLVHGQSGFQIGIEAKLRLNAKVICQAMSGINSPYDINAPDCRAVLVPSGVNHDFKEVCNHLNLTVLTVNKKSAYSNSFDCNQSKGWVSSPELPKPIAKNDHKWDAYLNIYKNKWYDFGPTERIILPEYVPDVVAGGKSPQVLSTWKIKAMRVCIWVERNTTINRGHFRALDISPSFWMNGSWLVKGDIRGEWIKGPNMPDLKSQHPTIYSQVEADYEKWVKAGKLIGNKVQGKLL